MILQNVAPPFSLSFIVSLIFVILFKFEVYFFPPFQISENADLEFFETSARTGEGVSEVKNWIIKRSF